VQRLPLPPHSRPITTATVCLALALGYDPRPGALARAMQLAPERRHIERARACVAALARKGRVPEEAMACL
jgi:hypothetical protein